MIILKLFWAFLTIGAVAFGGGYAMLPLFERMIVDDRGWLAMERFVDMIAISQVTPGPIAINSATFIGYIVGGQGISGFIGAAVSTLGVVFIPVVLVMIVSKYYDRFKNSHLVKGVFVGLRPALVGLIMASVFSVAINVFTASTGSPLPFDYFAVILAILLFVLLLKTKIHPILIIILSGILGIMLYL